MTTIDESKTYIQYAREVVSGQIVAGKYIIKSCQRFLDWFDRDDIYFDYDDVDKKITFMQKMKHFTDVHAGKPFILLPYQTFIVANIFGWKYVNEDNLRVTNNVLLLLARKSGKTYFASALSVVCAIADGQQNAEVYFIANSARQAEIAFNHALNQCESLDPSGKIFKRFRHDIRIPITKSTISILSSDTSKLDGLNPSCFVSDEIHENTTFETWNILKTGMGARRNGLAIGISSAGFHVGETFPLYSMCDTCKRILDGVLEDDSWFSMIYQLDDEDDWKDEDVWIKANPSLGQTVTHKYLRDMVKSATNNANNEVSIKTKNFNIWCQSKEIWLSYDLLAERSYKVDIKDYENEMVFCGVDLSVVADLTAFSICITPNKERSLNPDKFIFKTWLFIPQSALEESVNKEKYKQFIRQGDAIVTSGNVVDYEHILKEMLEVNKVTPFLMVEYDSYNSSQWAINATTSGLPLEPFSQSLGNFNKSTKFFEILVRSNKCIIDKNSAVLWCFSNAELMIDHNENVKPTKANGVKDNKIDPVISMLEALGGYLSSNYYMPEMFVI